jgi:hypothetical protein
MSDRGLRLTMKSVQLDKPSGYTFLFSVYSSSSTLAVYQDGGTQI